MMKDCSGERGEIAALMSKVLLVSLLTDVSGSTLISLIVCDIPWELVEVNTSRLTIGEASDWVNSLAGLIFDLSLSFMESLATLSSFSKLSAFLHPTELPRIAVCRLTSAASSLAYSILALMYSWSLSSYLGLTFMLILPTFWAALILVIFLLSLGLVFNFSV